MSRRPPSSPLFPYTTLFRSCTINNEAGVKAMTIRASIARQYGAEDPADSIATFPLPQMDWLKERCSMFSCHRSEEHTSELQSLTNLVCRLLLEKKKKHEQ